MNFTLNISSDNAGMAEAPDLAVADILDNVARWVRDGQTQGMVRDVNGHTVGSFLLVAE